MLRELLRWSPGTISGVGVEASERMAGGLSRIVGAMMDFG